MDLKEPYICSPASNNDRPTAYNCLQVSGFLEISRFIIGGLPGTAASVPAERTGDGSVAQG